VKVIQLTVIIAAMGLTRVSPLLSPSPVHRLLVRFAGGRWREQAGLPRRYQSPTPLTDLPEFSFVDGRGAGPLTLGRRAKYLRDQMFAQEIIQITGQMKEAKRLVPADERKPIALRPIVVPQNKY
jgi:hypothetical protein